MLLRSLFTQLVGQRGGKCALRKEHDCLMHCRASTIYRFGRAKFDRQNVGNLTNIPACARSHVLVTYQIPAY